MKELDALLQKVESERYERIEKQHFIEDDASWIQYGAVRGIIDAKAIVDSFEYLMGEDVYVTVSGGHFYRATLLGYGAYNKENKSYKTYCVMVHKDDRSFVDYFDKIYTLKEKMKEVTVKEFEEV
jgi:hypothetical protein